jgi:hypothetical protein
MKKVKAPPGARRLIESLRSLGYDFSTAVADLVDNSIAAQASEVYVDIYGQDGSRPPHVVIADNGHGMDREQLHEAMRFGAFQEYSPDELGKYGLGLKTASLSQCKVLTVASKAKAQRGTKPRRLLMRWDLDDVYKTDDWDLLAPTEDELVAWEQEALANPLAKEHGTVVLWSGLEEPLLSSDDVRARERYLARLIDDVSNHLRMVFHRFMEGSITGRKKLHLHVCGSVLEPWDPFCRTEKTRELDILKQKVDGRTKGGEGTKGDVTISPFVLPREDEFSTQHRWKAAAGPRNWNQQQGFYFYRNNRLLQAGGWSWLRAVDEHTKLLRVAVDFEGELDHAFSLNVTKMRAHFPAEIRESVSAAVSKWAKTARERYDRRPSASPANGGGTTTPKNSGAPKEPSKKPEAPPNLNIGKLSLSLTNVPTESLAVARGSQPGTLRIMVPQNHELAVAFNGKGSASDRELKRLCAAALAVLESVHERRIKPDDIPIVSLRRALKKAL